MDELKYSTYGATSDGYRFSLGVDLGQARDPSALAIIRERVTTPTARNGLPHVSSAYELVHLDRFGINQSYPAQVEHVKRTLARPPLSQWAETDLAFDATGVGRAVSDLARQKGLRHIPITITAGDGWTRDGNARRVSKSMLVGTLLTSLHDRRLKIAAGIPFAETLRKELTDFRVHYTEAGNATFNAREGAHDDLVLAVALAHWVAIVDRNVFHVSNSARIVGRRA